MPTPDASQYTHIKRLQAAQTASSSESPLKFRGPVGLSSYGFVPGFKSQFGVNVLRSNKLIPIYIPTSEILVNTEYNLECNTVGAGGFYTTATLLVFTPPTTRQYLIYFSGVTTLYKVQSTSTRKSYISDSESQTPNYFTNGNTVSLTAGQNLYLMPKASEGQTLTIQISNVSPPVSGLTNAVPASITTNILGEGGKYYTLRPLRFTNQSSLTRNCEIYFDNSILNGIRVVTSSTIPETAITDSTSVFTNSNSNFQLAPYQTIYLIPTHSGVTTAFIRVRILL
jgi:hypothetical protein